MKQDVNSKEWLQEFQEFLSAEKIDPPKHLSQQILSHVHTSLNPAPWLVFSKLASIHTLVGSITLLFCPQFGLSPFHGMGLMGFFMRFGEQACMLGCGAVFLGSSSLFASLLLRPEEVQVIRKTELLQFSILALASIGVFICAGTGIVFSLGFFWILGSIFGGLGTLELGWMIRAHFRKRLSHGI